VAWPGLAGGVRYHPDGDESDRVIEIDFTPPFKRISMLDGLEEAGGFKIPLPLESEECRAFLDRVCVEHNVRWFGLVFGGCHGCHSRTLPAPPPPAPLL
jgi:hypothetical protein